MKYQYLALLLYACTPLVGATDAAIASQWVFKDQQMTFPETLLKPALAFQALNLQDMNEENRHKTLEDLYIREILVKKGIGQDTSRSTELEERVNEFRKSELSRLALEKASEEGMPDFTARAKELYEANREDKYALPLRLRVRTVEMLIDEGQQEQVRQKLSDIRTQILSGKLDFKAAAIVNSPNSAHKMREGDSFWFRQGKVPDTFYSEAAKLSAENPLSSVLVLGNIAYLLQYLDRKEPETLTFEQVKPNIIAELQREYRTDKVKQLTQQLRDQFKRDVTVNPVFLKPQTDE
ncbi:peptidylprolyl isomerase [Thiothrix subterranea]|uniref:peptidylprolyl isomerase n=2 Tax=Thiothrix subterranea TaxID=2735563 RepID=A0ABU0YCU8_9GAMM|nr:peptidylprolyl isomerase [Thiothrix subterranea]MDQ5769547.1 peptidylprolyl isomerase [Thiothrix subterranea]